MYINSPLVPIATGVSFAVLAAASQVDLRSDASHLGETTIGVLTGVGATAATVISIWSGANQMNVFVTIAGASQSGGFHMVVTNARGPLVNNNDATIAAHYTNAAYLWAI